MTTAQSDAITALLAQADALGISVADLAAAMSAAPTVSEYIASILPTATRGQEHTYTPYLQKFAATHGSLRLTEVTTTIATGFVENCQRDAVTTRGRRRNSRDGRSAKENAIAALRWMFTRAIGDHHVNDNPAAGVRKPARPRTTRHGLTASQVQELFQATASGGDDPALDALLVRFFLESGARREGVLSLRLRDIDQERSTVLLREKNDKDGSEQPVSPSLIRAVLAQARARGATAPEDAVFRYKPRKGTKVGAPLTRRRFNTLTNRWQATLPWAARVSVTPHVLRHTAIGLVESDAGYSVARAFARHQSKREVTTTYLQRTICDVAQAIERLTEEPHPLAARRWELG